MLGGVGVGGGSSGWGQKPKGDFSPSFSLSKAINKRKSKGLCVCVLNPQKMQRAQGSFLLLHSHFASHCSTLRTSSTSTTSSAPLLRHPHPFCNISGIFYNPEINIWKEATQQLLWPVTNKLFQSRRSLPAQLLCCVVLHKGAGKRGQC